MESEGKRGFLAVAIFEALGTLLLVYFAVTGDHNPVAISLAFFVSYLLFAQISGGHFNPAVSFAVYLAEGSYLQNIPYLLLLWISQIVGAVGGAYLAFLVLARHRENGTYSVAELFIPKLCPKDPHDPTKCDTNGSQHLQLLAIQAMTAFIFVLSFVNLRKKGVRPSEDGVVAAAAITLVFFGLTHVGNQGGASFNPVLSAALLFFEKIASNHAIDGITKYLWSYIVGPMAGAILSAAFACCIRCFLAEDEEEEENGQKSSPRTGGTKSTTKGNMGLADDPEKQSLLANQDNTSDKQGAPLASNTETKKNSSRSNGAPQAETTSPAQ